MMNLPRKALLSCGVAAGALAIATGAWAQQRAFDIPAQSATKAVPEFARQAGVQIISSGADLRGLQSAPLKGEFDVRLALAQLLDGTGLTYRGEGDTFIIEKADSPQSGGVAGDGADQGTVAALIVTAQKREENIQDVPIAMSAFTQEDLTKSQVTGGPDLMTQVPNFTFTKTNFSGYSIQIRGIGTQAVSATTDAAVAAAFNNTPFIRNRFFEQEFYDLQRVEVLRGPQGTLYGRNATAGVVNILSAKPKFSYEARLSADIGNYKSHRLEGMINIPLVEDKVALRLAGAWTKRDGYDTNSVTGNHIDGRDLWSTRLSLRVAPTDRVEANLIWEHFQEDDDRLRSGKQLCHTDEVTEVAGFPTTHYQVLPELGQPTLASGVQASFSQGCSPASLYAPESFETPNGLSLPYYAPLGVLRLPIGRDDPYVSRVQSRDLRGIESTVDPEYRAKTDTAELQLSFDLTDRLTLTSESAYLADVLFSMEDYNRFNTAPGAWAEPEGIGGSAAYRDGVLQHGPNGGIFCDPQVGCADRLVAVDLSRAKSRQFSQELRLASSNAGAFNFSLGANFLRYDTEDKYYVFFNSVSMVSALSMPTWAYHLPYLPGVSDNSECLRGGFSPPDPGKIQDVAGCQYLETNGIGDLQDLGHNYFLSKNPYKLISYAAFGEIYYALRDNLKLTAGLRWTVDKKEAPSIPSWVLASDTVGYPVVEVIRQEWKKPTGRLTIDWKPDLSFTGETLIYGSVAHGYKAGGANPPPAGALAYGNLLDSGAVATAKLSATHPKTFDAEYVNAFEIGAKNTLLDGRLTLNANTFYYDYTGYQISQIVDRSAVNLNFDARIWGVELEADWRPAENLRLGFKGGYENTRVADGQKAIDLMDRTSGHAGWVVVRPFPTYTSNCILPEELFVGQVTDGGGLSGMDQSGQPQLVDLGAKGGGHPGPCELAYALGRDPVTDAPYADLTTVTATPAQGELTTLFVHPGYKGWNPAWAPNHGEGFDKDLGGNELPNAPHVTATITADYTLPLPNDWLMTLHSDFYYQSEAWTRIFNTPGYDKLKAYTNVNLAAIFSNEDAGWKVMAYVKNVFDHDAITGAFLNSDDTGLTTNVFLNEPRLYGLRVTKEWTGQGGWTGANPAHPAGEPYPLTVEIGGGVQRLDAPYETITPGFISAFPEALDPLTPQHRDLDWGDERSVRVTYKPEGSIWNLSAGVRYGRINGGSRSHAEVVGPTRCISPTTGKYAVLGKLSCDPTYYLDWYGNVLHWYSPNNLVSATSSSDASANTREKHLFADFSIGRDVGVGAIGLSKSSLSGGLKYAELDSDTDVEAGGMPDWNVPDAWGWYPTRVHQYKSKISADRRFKGAGPVLNWDAAARLLGNTDTGVLDLDWSIGGGVLFGKQKTTHKGGEDVAYHEGVYQNSLPVTYERPTRIDLLRDKSAFVPVVDLSLGLSYDIQRIKLSTGYHWERYFNVLDAGYTEHKSYDRTFDGPYFKIALGFGG